MENKNREDWVNKAEQQVIKKSELLRQSNILTEEMKREQLEGMRIFVVKNTKTGEVAPMTIVYGKDFDDYDHFMDAVEKVSRDFYAEHGIDKDGLNLEDRWARTIEEFRRDNPELLRYE